MRGSDPASLVGSRGPAACLVGLLLVAVPAVVACTSTHGGGGGGGAACESKDATTAEPLVYWTADERLRGSVELWNKNNPQRPVTMVVQPAAVMLSKLQEALGTGKAPDIADVSVLDVPNLVHSGDVACYETPGDYAKVHSYVALGRPFFPYGIPVDLNPIVTFYRKSALSQVSNLKTDPSPEPWITYDGLKTAAEDYFAKTGKALLNLDLKGDPALFSALVWQHGGTWFRASDDHKTYQVSISSEPTRYVATYWDGLIGERAVTTSIMSEALSTSTPMLLAPLSLSGSLKTLGTASEWGVALLPQEDEDTPRCGNEPRRFLVIPHHGPGDPPRREAAAAFMQWLTTDHGSLERQLQRGIFPASPAAYTLDAAKHLDSLYGIDGLADTAAASVAGLTGGFEYGPDMAWIFDEQTGLLAKNTSLAASMNALQASAVTKLQGSYTIHE